MTYFVYEHAYRTPMAMIVEKKGAPGVLIYIL